MPKKEDAKELKERIAKKIKQDSHPLLNPKLTFSQKASDSLTKWMGSWTFILIFIILMIAWIWLNGYYLAKALSGIPFDPFPYILLNLVLSTLAAIQAPIILMSQNRESQKDRIRSEYDYAVNRKAEKEIEEIQKQLDRIERHISKKK
ncbi:hypothetical protein CMI45_00830 [Candidatus Pacearchaeota archaeon]|nr:hypothetical protein [Candidatus Pacearchaeota archaeon]|tara:strand:+ start:87 stop:530 length:444 start_codon:yes stop_codon:yes gene_type:complete